MYLSVIKFFKSLSLIILGLVFNFIFLPEVSNASSAMVSASATNGRHTCAVTASGSVECWGLNSVGQLGNGTTTNSNRAIVVTGFSSGGATVSTGEDHSCALNSSGAVSCWGGNAYGQLGNGTNTNSSTPVTVSLSGSAIAVAATGFTTCAVTSNGGVQCWGLNGAGQLGNGTTSNRNIPVSVSGLSSGVVALAGGGSGYICALTSSGGVKCWGDNTSGSLGNGTTSYAYTPSATTGLTSGVIAITAGSGHACALTSSGAVKCWGSNNYGQLGNGTTSNSLTPVAVSGMSTGITAISAGGFHTCALTSFGEVKCWGYNADGELGIGSIPISAPWGISTPTSVSGFSTSVSAISAGFKHTCAITIDGKIDCWGNNQSGQLGNGTNVTSGSPVNALDQLGLLNLQTTQAITFSNAPNIAVGSTAILSAVASSGLTVTFGTSTPTVCSVNGTSVIALKTGTCIVTSNQAGNTSYSAAIQVTQNITVNSVSVPGSPTKVSATLGNASAAVSFNAPSSNGGAAITSYTVTSSGGQTATGATSPITVSGLTNGVAYAFTVNANNSAGSSPAASTVGSLSPVAPAAVLTAPTSVSAVAGNASATVSFTGASELTTKLTGSGSLAGTPGGTQNYNFLEIDTSKYPSGGTMSIKITLGNGNSGASYDLFHSDAVVVTNGSPVGSLAYWYDVSPGSVTNLSYAFSPTATNKYKLGLEGNWDSATTATNTYTYEVTLTGNSTTPNYTVTSNPGGVVATGTASPILVTGLSNGTTYTFTLSGTASAVSSGASSSSLAVTPLVPVTVPGVPTGVSAVAGNASATVSFTAPSSNGGAAITNYTVTSSGGQTATGSSSPIIVNGLTSGVQYVFTVTASNSAGTSAASSNSNIAVYYANLPPAPSVTAVAGNASATVNITSSTGSCIAGGTISCYLVPAGMPSFSVTASPGGMVVASSSPTLTVSGLTNGTSYTFKATMTTSTGTSAASAASNAVTPVAPVTVPGAPTGVSAVAGNASATVSFAVPSNNGGASITSYSVTSSPGGKTASGSASPLTVSGLSNGTAYTFTVTATNVTGTSTASGASSSITPSLPAIAVSLLGGWNLIGNGYKNTIDVASILSDTSKITTVWKWVPETAKWAFYAPTLSTQALADYAANKGYDVLSAVNAGEGFWVNVRQAFDLQMPTDTQVLTADFQTGGGNELRSGWNLVSIGENKYPSNFNFALSISPPTTGNIPISFTTVWAWEATTSKWYFYAPSLEANGGLINYTNSKSYLDFSTNKKMLVPGVGFWVNKP